MTTINKKRIKYHLFYQNHHHHQNFLSYHQLIIFPVFLLLRLRETQNALQFFLFAILFFLIFFYFPFPSPVFGPTGKRFLSFVPQNACDRYWACFFGHTGKCFVLILFTVISVWEVLV